MGLIKNIISQLREITSAGTQAAQAKPLAETNVGHPYVVSSRSCDYVRKAEFINPQKGARITAPDMEIDEDGVLKKYTGQEEVVTVPDGVIRIGTGAFQSNEAIKEVILPESLTEIGDDAFESSSLERIVIPSGVKKMGCCVFQCCHKLNSVTLPDQLSRIDFGTFFDCCELKRLKLPSELKEVRVGIFGGAFDRCGIEELRIPEGMAYIGKNAFSYMECLEKLYLPKSLKGIGEEAFSFCNNLKEVQLPEGLLEIGRDAFDACSKLEKVTFPSTLVSIGRNAFARTKMDASKLKEIYEKVNSMEVFPKPNGYQETVIREMKFYYRSENLIREFEGLQESDVLERYALRFDRELTDSWSIYRDKDGRSVVMLFESVPTFDSGDREWDSYKKFFLIPDAGKMKGILIRGGYRIAKVVVYEDVRFADSRTEKRLKM